MCKVRPEGRQLRCGSAGTSGPPRFDKLAGGPTFLVPLTGPERCAAMRLFSVGKVE